MEGTKPKSIFDIPKPIPPEEPPKKPKRKRSKKKAKKPKVAKAGGVEVSQKQNVKGQKQITLKHKGGLTQEITIYTGDQKPRGAKAKGQTANWNMKPAKFKKSRGLRDDRVYLQPPKREYFGNRYKSALDKIKIDQKVKEAGASKNKEIADVRDRSNKEKKELERREKVKDDTISELKREKAGIVASHNVSQRNQSRATILGGDVGELNKLINRRGYDAIRRLVVKGEITDVSTILQLDLDPRQIDRLTALLEGEQADFTTGSKVVYLTGTGISQEGRVLSETTKFVNVRKADGREVKVPKTNIQSGQKVAESRSASKDPNVRSGRSIPTATDFGSPRPAGSSADERPAHRRDVKSAGAEKRQKERRKAVGFVGEVDGAFTESSDSDEPSPLKTSPETKLKKAVGAIRESLQTTLDTRAVGRTGGLEEALAIAEATSPPTTSQTLDEILKPEPQPEPVVESDISSGVSGEEETGLRLELESEVESDWNPDPNREKEDWEIEAEKQFAESGQTRGIGDLVAEPESQPTPREFFEGLQKGQVGTLPRQRSAERRAQIDQQRREREASQERVLQQLEDDRTFGAKTRPAVKPVITAQSLLQRQLSPESAAIRRGREFSKSLGLVPPRDFGGGAKSMEDVAREAKAFSERQERLRREREGSSTGSFSDEPTFYSEREIREIESDFEEDVGEKTFTSETESLAVDSRKANKRQNSDGDTERPSKVLTYRQIRRKINFVYKEQPTTKRRTLEQLQRAQEKQKAFRTTDKKLLDALGF